MASINKREKAVRLTAVQVKEILILLARREKRKNIAAKYNTNEKAISRVREQALTYSSTMRATLPKEVQEYLTLWEETHSKKAVMSPKIVLSNNINQVVVSDDNHVEDLSNCAKELVKILGTYIGWPPNYRVENILNDLKDFENLKFFENKLTRGVLVHLAQSEDFPQLKRLDTWINLKIGDINESFLALISLKAASREFQGECDICRPKPDSNRKVA